MQFLTHIKPRWMILQKLKEKPFIHFDLKTFGSNHIIPFEFKNKHLPPDKYIKK